MHRGLVTLTQTQIETLLQSASANTLLAQKLANAKQQNTDPASLELNEEEVEQLLDIFPEPETDVALRNTLSTFLAKLRS